MLADTMLCCTEYSSKLYSRESYQPTTQEGIIVTREIRKGAVVSKHRGFLTMKLLNRSRPCIVALVVFACLIVTIVTLVAVKRSERRGAATGDETQHVIDCEVRTIFEDDVINGDSVSYECATYANEGAEDMVYSLPNWLLAQYSAEFQSRATSYLQISSGQIVRVSPQTGSLANLRSVQPNDNDSDSGDRVVINRDAAITISDTP